MSEETQTGASIQKDVMPWINGKSYRCSCGANVFRWVSHDRMRCNGCGDLYEAVKDDKEKAGSS